MASCSELRGRTAVVAGGDRGIGAAGEQGWQSKASTSDGLTSEAAK